MKTGRIHFAFKCKTIAERRSSSSFFLSLFFFSLSLSGLSIYFELIHFFTIIVPLFRSIPDAFNKRALVHLMSVSRDNKRITFMDFRDGNWRPLVRLAAKEKLQEARLLVCNGINDAMRPSGDINN